MSEHADLPLFAHRSGKPAVIPFPAKARVGKIRRMVEVVTSIGTKKGVEAHWKRSLADLRRQMERAGIDAEIIDREVASFEAAVQSELSRVVYSSDCR